MLRASLTASTRYVGLTAMAPSGGSPIVEISSIPSKPATTVEETSARGLLGRVGARIAASSFARARLLAPPWCQNGLRLRWRGAGAGPSGRESWRRAMAGTSAAARSAGPRGFRTRRNATKRTGAMKTFM
ncbi:MAG: hypothetical protein DMD83_20510 [Candidatus Rokuibacteriota bacterium]|nr:MAG: hypothetical protein DMD83_20510 [Candidatus Rokubacteria bacterium]